MSHILWTIFYVFCNLKKISFMNIWKDLVHFTNLRIEQHNSNVVSNRRKVKPITEKELKMTIAILIIGRQENGTMEFSLWYKNRLLNPNINMFQEIGGISSAAIKFLSITRFFQILRFLSPGKIKYIIKKGWKKSSAVAHQLHGGYFVNLNERTLDLNLLFDKYVNAFNANSRSVYKCNGTVTLDEILSACKSRRNLIKQYNVGKRDKIGILWHLLNDAKSKFCIKTRLKLTKQFTDPNLYKIEGLCLDFLDDFRGSFVRVCQDNYFNSFGLCSTYNDLGLYVFGTCRKLVIQRYFADHSNGLANYLDTKSSKKHNLVCFTHDEYDHSVRGKIHAQVYNSPGRTAVIFITNSNSVLGLSTESSSPDYRTFMGGHYSRDFPATHSRPYTALHYNTDMGSVDTFDQYIHKHTLRYIPMKNKLSWILKPTLSILDYELLNSFFLLREINPTSVSDYRLHLLKIAQGLVSESLKTEMVPLRIPGYDEYSRHNCSECKDISPRKDARTSKVCIKCGFGCCKTHSHTICNRCL